MLCPLLGWADNLTTPKRRTVGVILPLTGPLAVLGVPLKNAVILADETLDSSDRVRFIFEDDGFDPKKTVSAFRKLAASGVDGLITFGSGTSLAVAPISEKAELPLIALAISDKVTENRQFVYQHFLAPRLQTARILEELKRRNYKSIAIISTSQEAMLVLSQDLKRKLQGVSVVVDQELVPGDVDLRAVALKVKDKNPAAVYLLLIPPQMAVFSQQLRSTGYNGALFSGPIAQHVSEVKAARGALEGAWFVTADDSRASSYFLQYRKRFGGHPVPDAAYGYDAASLYIGAADDGFIQYFAELKGFDGIFGWCERVGRNTFKIPTTIKVIAGDEFKLDSDRMSALPGDTYS